MKKSTPTVLTIRKATLNWLFHESDWVHIFKDDKISLIFLYRNWPFACLLHEDVPKVYHQIFKKEETIRLNQAFFLFQIVCQISI